MYIATLVHKIDAKSKGANKQYPTACMPIHDTYRSETLD